MVKTIGKSVVDFGQWVHDMMRRPTRLMDSELRDLGLPTTTKPQDNMLQSMTYYHYPRA